ncbi:MAG: hypothetical protein M3680_22960 [Myxococcota bacterium]|nr:hypothetical protein [Myxococcota bacterium]
MAAPTACTSDSDDPGTPDAGAIPATPDSGSGGPACGNRVCEATETTASCAADCPAATCTVADPTSCSGETVCIGTTCQNAFGRNYRIKVGSAVFTEKKADGSAWDVGGGLPDGMVTLTVNGATRSTPVIDNTLTPTWNYVTPPTLIPGGTVLKIEVLDADVASNDLAWTCTRNPLTAAQLRAGLRCSGVGALAAARVDLTFTPN